MTTDTRKISLCITTYNRTDLTIRSFAQVLNHSNIDEIVIVDDNSKPENYAKLRSLLVSLGSSKIRLFRNSQNLDCYQNKKRSVELAKNEWVIIFDSDNVINVDYIDTLVALEEWVPDCIYAPEFAKPHFDYRALSGYNIHAGNVSQLMEKKGFDAMINTCNYFVNRGEYLAIHKSDIDPHAADTAYFNYCWLSSGGTIKVLSGLQYQHDVHDGSHYKEHNHKSNGLFNELMGKFRRMSQDFNDSLNSQKKVPIFSEYINHKEETETEKGIERHESWPRWNLDSTASIVTVKPQGRCGNALFQYANAIAYALKHGLRFSIPRGTNDKKWNPIYLEHLLIPHGVPDISIKEKTYFKYDELEFKEEWRYGKVIELEGYFQNPKYFQEYKKEILEAFGLKWENKPDTISIHERRGDYLIYTDKHPAFSDEYMCNAINHFDKKGFKKFLVFSDDIPWCRNYFSDKKFSKYEINFQEGKSEMEDIVGIASCAGHINSPSTFSWWGSWIGDSPAGNIARTVWLLHKHANEWTDEIIPKEWIRL